MGELGRENRNSPTWWSIRQGGDNIGRKARIVASSIADRKVKTVVDDEHPVLVFRFDGEAWARWSVAWQRYEPADIPPPLRAHLESEHVVPEAGDRFRLDAGQWLRVPPDDKDVPS